MVDVDKEALSTVCHLAVHSLKDKVAQINDLASYPIERFTEKMDEPRRSRATYNMEKAIKYRAEFLLRSIQDVENVCDLDSEDLQKYIDDMKIILKKMKGI